MGIFQKLDFDYLGALIRGAKSRVMLCVPGIDDAVASAIIEAHRRLGANHVQLVVDASDRAARLGYGYFDALKMVHEHGLAVRVEPGLRMGVAIIDEVGLCFAMPALLVDELMENAKTPNAILLTSDQINAIASAMMPSARPSTHDLANKPKPEIGNEVLTSAVVKQINRSLDQNSPQKFDVARKVNVFNAFLEFVELEVVGIEIKRMSVKLPQDLLASVKDADTRRRFSTSFQLIDENAGIHQKAVKMRRQADELRKTYTRVLPSFGAVVLRSTKTHLESAFQAFQHELKSFALTVEAEIGKELDHSRAGLIRALLPGFRDAPPPSLLAEIIPPVTDVHLERWLNRRLDNLFRTPEELRTQMQATLVFKGVDYRTLIDKDFQRAVRAVYPDVDFDKPLEEFVAAKESK